MSHSINENTFDYDHLSILSNVFKGTFEKSYYLEDTLITIQKEVEEDIFKQIIKHYYKHTQNYNVSVKGVCPYKFFSWYGFMLAEKIYKQGDKEAKILSIQAISTAIICMLKLLELEGVVVEESFHKKALEMVIKEISGRVSNNLDHIKCGLGMNGLYMMFRMASVCKKS